MKKIVFAIITLLLISGTVHSQDEKMFRFGLNTNMGFAWMKSNQDSLEFQGVRLGLGYGFITEISLANNFAISTGFDVLYTGGKLQQAGVNYAFDSIPLSVTKNSMYRFQHIDVPITLKMRTNEINYMKFFAKIGASLGVALGGKAEYNYKATGGNRNETIKVDKLGKDMKLLRANFIIGGGMEYSLGGSTSLLGEISFSNGLTYLLDNTKANGNYISLKFGVLF